jgi:hypothetical protein
MPILHRVCATFASGLVAAPITAQSGWIQAVPTVHPAGRSGDGLAYDSSLGVTVLFGGIASPTGSMLADTWTWDGTNWSQRTPAHSPPVRWGLALTSTFGTGRILLFGGRNGNTSVDFGDTWEYDGVDWAQRQPAHQPSARHRMQLSLDPTSGRILLFGGGTGPFSLTLGDTWDWDGTDWTQRNPPASPPARWGYGMTYDLLHNRVVLWGGNNLGLGALNDTWIWNGSTWSQVATATAPPAAFGLGIVHDLASDRVVLAGGAQTWLFDGNAWRSDPRPGPPQRSYGGLTYDLTRGRTVLFGGSLFPSPLPDLADTWEYTPGPVASWAPLGSGCPGSAGIPQLGPSGTSLPITGATFVLELTHLPASGTAVFASGLSATQWAGGALPADLAAFGMPNCMLRMSPDYLSFASVIAGRTTLAWPVPNAPSLIGARFWNQALASDPGVNAAGAVVANAGEGLIEPF